MVAKIAHRGMSASFPENTILAIEQGIASHADYVEVDIRLSKDRIPIVFHDESLERTTQSPHLIEHLTYEELKEVDAGSWHHEKYKGLQIPSLEEILALEWKNTGLMLEIKQGKESPQEMARIVIQILQRHRLPEKFVIGSFSHQILAEFLNHHFKKHNLLGILENLQYLPLFQKLGITRYAIWYPLLNEDCIRFLHASNFHVWAFTVDEAKEIHRLVDLGVDGIISNIDLTKVL